MPFRLIDLQKETRTINIAVGSQEGQVEYRVNVITPAFVRELSKIDTIHESLVHQVTQSIVSWDVLGMDDEPVDPTDPEQVYAVPTLLLKFIMDQVAEDISGEVSQKKVTYSPISPPPTSTKNRTRKR